MEIGETFEMAVAREVKEESGIDIDRTSVRCLLLFSVSVSLCFICIFLCVRIFVLLLVLNSSLCWLWNTRVVQVKFDGWLVRKSVLTSAVGHDQLHCQPTMALSVVTHGGLQRLCN